jgi:HSP20 family protein
MAERELAPWSGPRGLTAFGRDPFFNFRREMDRLFDDFLTPAEPRSFASRLTRGAFPNIDVEQTKDGYKLTAELPGLDQRDVQLSLRDNMLLIFGEKRDDRTEKDGDRTISERAYGRFERVIPLDVDIDSDKAQATFRNGVLTVTLPKSAKAHEKDHRIEVKPG